MKKITLVSLFFIFLMSSCSSSRKSFITEKPKNEKSTVSFKEPKASICFFGGSCNSAAYLKHQAQKIELYNYLSPMSGSVPVFDIADGKLIEYNNQSGKTFFYGPLGKDEFGMLVSNGIDKPIMVTDPKKYKKEIAQYLKIDDRTIEKEKKRIEEEEKMLSRDLEKINKSPFVYDKTYSDALLKNANSLQYPRAKKYKSKKDCFCDKQTIETYSDIQLSTKKVNDVINYYNKNQQIVKSESLNGNNLVYKVDYYRNTLGLIDSIISKMNNEYSKTQFIYREDKYYAVQYYNNKPIGYETYFLNDIKQNIGRQLFSKKSKSKWDFNYSYDALGRIKEEKNKTRKIVYTYKDSITDNLLEYVIFDVESNKLLQKNTFETIKNKTTTTGYDEDNSLKFKSITSIDSNCNTIQFDYDSQNTLVDVVVASCNKKEIKAKKKKKRRKK